MTDCNRIIMKTKGSGETGLANQLRDLSHSRSPTKMVLLTVTQLLRCFYSL